MFTLRLELKKQVPTYTYTCTACNDLIEKRQSFSDPPLTTCEECGGTLRKIIHPVGIVFKGSGWYVTDSRSASSTASNGSGSTGSEKKAAEPAKDGAAASKSGETSSSSSS